MLLQSGVRNVVKLDILPKLVEMLLLTKLVLKSVREEWMWLADIFFVHNKACFISKVTEYFGQL